MSDYVVPGGLASNWSDLDMGIEELELSVHGYKCLKIAGISTVHQLCDMTAEEVRNTRHLNSKDYDEICGRLKDLGLSFKTVDYSHPMRECLHSDPVMTVQDEHMIEELIRQITEQPEDSWYKPGQVKSWVYCISIGKPLYQMKLVEIKNDLKDGCYKTDSNEPSDLFGIVRTDFCAHYYLNDIDAEKIVLLFAKILMYHPLDEINETEITVGNLYKYYTNPANEYPDIQMGEINKCFETDIEELFSIEEITAIRTHKKITARFSNEEIESTDLERFDLSKTATCDFMRNGYITAGDYLERSENSKEVREESAVEFYNELVKCRYYGYSDIEYSHPEEVYEGKKKCNILREIRRQIAADNDIQYYSEDCTFMGECPGTCPKCDDEIRYLQKKLDERKAAGLEVVLNRIDPKMLDGASNKQSIDSIFNKVVENIERQGAANRR